MDIETQEPVTDQDQPERPRKAPRAAAIAVAAVLVGGGAAFAVDQRSGSTAASAAQVAPGLASRGGGVAGEKELQGTVTARTAASVTIREAGGRSATYRVDATSEIITNGASARLADVKVGDPVLVDVVPSSAGGMVVERLFAGTPPSGSGGGFAPPGAAPSGAGAPASGVSID